LLEAIRNSGNDDIAFVYISTDEVFGPWEDKFGAGYAASDPLNPRNPYSATKAAAEMIVKGWASNYKYPTVICRLCNIFGQYQYPEKLIPKAVIRTIKGEKVPLYGDGLQVREWTHVHDVCTAIEACMRYVTEGSPRVWPIQAFNFSTGWECTNKLLMEYVKEVIPSLEIEYVKDRPGHDFRYKMNNERARMELGWKPTENLQNRVHETVRWYVDNKPWWERILTKVPNVLSKQPWLEKWQ
jgi:dTDP-glucose 4,6-dehydratase